MTLPVVPPGPMSFSQINTELNLSSTAQISLNDAAVRTLAGVGASPATIAITNLSGKSNTFPFSFAGGTNIDLRIAAINAGWNGASQVIATNTGTVQSASTGSYALTISGFFPNGVAFINDGLIVGRGGNGGAGGDVSNVAFVNGGTGNPAGPALLVSSAVTITNNSTIAGGGGGGGGGAAAAGGRAGGSGGGGGGGGIGVSSGGGGGTANTSNGATNGAAGSPGTTTALGAGAPTTNRNNVVFGGAGGAGGGYGTAGVNGSNASFSGVSGAGGTPGNGGAAGSAVVGNSNITWAVLGNRYGAIT